MAKTYKQIEESRNTRLWITSVVLPVASCATMVLSNPENRKAIKDLSTKVCDKIDTKIKTVKLNHKLKQWRKNNKDSE